MAGPTLILGATLGIKHLKSGLRPNRDGEKMDGNNGRHGRAAISLIGLNNAMIMPLLLLPVVIKSGLWMEFRAPSCPYQTHHLQVRR
eukprot:10040559-Karenia_brevis.AAC.1